VQHHSTIAAGVGQRACARAVLLAADEDRSEDAFELERNSGLRKRVVLGLRNVGKQVEQIRVFGQGRIGQLRARTRRCRRSCLREGTCTS